jgi:SAM-dependent methyltransferase
MTIHHTAWGSPEGSLRASSATRDLCGDDIVLAIPGGTGTGLLRAAGALGPSGRVIGLEADPTLVARARAGLRAADITNAQVWRWYPPQIPEADESVDRVFADRVVTLSPDPPRMCGEIARVLRRGGTVRTAEIVGELTGAWPRGTRRPDGPFPLPAWEERHLVDCFSRAGLIGISLGGRYVFDRSEVAGLFDAGCSDAEVAEIAGSAVGRVWSVVLSAVKTE